MKYFEDFEVGQTQQSSKSHLVTEEEIIEFGTRWDSQPFHTDPVAAEKSEFGGLIASSTQLFSISVSLWSNPDIPEGERAAAISALGFNNMKLRIPARPGDVLTSMSTVIEKRDSRSRPNAGIVVLRDVISNQNKEIVFELENAALITKEKPT